MLAAALARLVSRQDLSREEARDVLRLILQGTASEPQIAALLVALAMKGETVEEIVGFAQAMREAITPLPAPTPTLLALADTGRDALVGTPGLPPAPSAGAAARLVDTCGTGGDASGTFNISTATALTVAGAGVRVAKHGNRSISSRCGSADVIEALGVAIDLPPEGVARCLEEVGIAFLFAPAWHPAMRHVQPVRRALRLRTIFNILGPLTNPAGAGAQVVGVYSAALTDTLAAALLALGAEHAFVVHGEDGLDEFSTTAPTRVAEVRGGRVIVYRFDATEYGLPRAQLADLAGGDIEENVRAVRAVLAGEPGPRRDVVVLNAAAALLAAGRAPEWPAALDLARKSLDSGAAARKLAALAALSHASA